MRTTWIAWKLRLRVIVAAASVVAGTAAPAAAHDEDEAAITVRAGGLRIIAPPPDGNHQLSPFGAAPGTTLAVLVERPAGGLITVDPLRSKIDAFTDSQGHNLLGDVRRRLFGAGPSLFMRVSEGGKTGMVQVRGEGLPRAGSQSVRASGVLALRIGTDQRTDRQEDVAVDAGSRIDEAGPVTFTITDIGEHNFGIGAEPTMTLRTQHDLEQIAAIRFLDEAGEIDSRVMRSSVERRLDGPGRAEQVYRMNRQPETITVEIDYWAKVQVVEVPFDIEATWTTGAVADRHRAPHFHALLPED